MTSLPFVIGARLFTAARFALGFSNLNIGGLIVIDDHRMTTCKDVAIELRGALVAVTQHLSQSESWEKLEIV